MIAALRAAITAAALVVASGGIKVDEVCVMPILFRLLPNHFEIVF